MMAHGKGSLAAKLVREGYEEWRQDPTLRNKIRLTSTGQKVFVPMDGTT